MASSSVPAGYIGQQVQVPNIVGGTEFPAHLKVLKQLGKGAYGTVHLCEDISQAGSPQVAVKHIKNAARHGKSILREVRLLARLCHENLLQLVDFPAVTGTNFEDVFLVLPYLPSDLHKVIQSRQALTDKHVQVICVQMLRAVAHLHASGVAHRDLKPANILLSADCKLKICDFGLARGDMPDIDGEDNEPQACGVLTEYVITRWYRAPEVMLLPKGYTSAVDLWSIGCIICEILGRKALFPGKNHIDMICRVAEVIGSPADSEISWLPKDSDAYRFLRKVCPQTKGKEFTELYPRATPDCLDLANSLLRWDPTQRLTASEAQEHAYLKAYKPKEPVTPPQAFDWTFDGFKATSNAVKERLYLECVRYHPEICDRDRISRPPVSLTPTVPFTPPNLQTGSPGGYPAAGPPPTKLGTPVQQGRSPGSAQSTHRSTHSLPQPYPVAREARASTGSLHHGSPERVPSWQPEEQVQQQSHRHKSPLRQHQSPQRHHQSPQRQHQSPQRQHQSPHRTPVHVHHATRHSPPMHGMAAGHHSHRSSGSGLRTATPPPVAHASASRYSSPAPAPGSRGATPPPSAQRYGVATATQRASFLIERAAAERRAAMAAVAGAHHGSASAGYGGAQHRSPSGGAQHRSPSLRAALSRAPYAPIPPPAVGMPMRAF